MLSNFMLNILKNCYHVPVHKATWILSEVHGGIAALIPHVFQFKTTENDGTLKQLFQHTPHFTSVHFF